MKLVVLVLLMVGFVSAVDVDFDCPDKIFVGEEFECSLEILDGDGVYDVKVEIDQERNSVLKIWDEGNDKWLSGYYYLKEFVEDEADVRLKVSEVGRYDGVLKLRQGDKREFFEVGEFIVRRGVVDDEGLVMDDVITDEVVVLGNVRDEVVVLGGDVVYESRDSKVVDLLPYGFAVFLIFVIGVLVWER